MGEFYAGIGSRSTPPDLLRIMATVSRSLNKEGLTLRSGGAQGADSAFEEGAGVQKEVYLPWQGFNSRYAEVKAKNGYLLASSQPGWKEALDTVNSYHPSPENLSPPGRLLMARNAMQILGKDLKTPSRFVVCWTSGGKERGGRGGGMECRVRPVQIWRWLVARKLMG